jgi:hypothetical protein
MGSKQLVRRERSTLAVIKATDQFGPSIGTALAELLRPALAAGETLPDLSFAIVLAQRTLQRQLDAFVAANTASEIELADDAEPRERRDKLEAEIRAHISAARAVVSDLYGAAGLAAFKLTSPAEPGPAAAARYATTLIEALRAPRPELRTVLATRAVSFQPAALADDLAPLVTALQRALEDVARERAEAAQVTVARNAALAANDASFMALAGLIEAMARAAGKHEVADRIRPSTREPGILVDEPVTPADDTEPSAPKPVSDPNKPGADPFGS